MTRGEKVLACSALAFFVCSFVPWYGTNGYSRNGWSYIVFGIVPVLAAVVIVGQIAISRFTDAELPDPPITWGQVHLIAGGTAAVLVLLRLLITDKYDFHHFLVVIVSLHRKVGIYLAFVATLGMLAGGYLTSRETTPAPEPAAPPAG